MKKCILLFLLFICCFGCKARYNLVINDDLTVEETIVGLETEDFYDKYEYSTKESVVSFAMVSKESYLNKNNFNIKNIEEDSWYGAQATKKYNDIKDYFNKSKAYAQFYDGWNIDEYKGIITIKTTDWLHPNHDSLDRYYVTDGAIVTIKLPFRVIKNNADHYDRNNNEYSWDISKKKEIYLKFDSNKTAKQQQSQNVLMIIILLVILLVSFISYAFYKKKKNDNI